MASTGKKTLPSDPVEQEIRGQEVLRANKELAAYFKGRRTEREARAALKIIKAFIRDRERVDPASRRPLPGAEPSRASAKVRARKRTAGPSKERPRKPSRPVPIRRVKDADLPGVVSVTDGAAHSSDEPA